MRKTWLSLALTMLATPALAANVVISHAALRLIVPTSPAAGYFDIANNGNAAAILTGAHSTMCGSMMMHRSLMDASGTSRMIEAPRVIVPAHGAVSFKTGSYHLMCEQPSAALAAVHTVTVTLEFLGGATKDVTFTLVDAKGASR